MMNSEEFTRFLNELRAEYDLPPKFDKDMLMSSHEEMDTNEEILTEEDCVSLKREDLQA